MHHRFRIIQSSKLGVDFALIVVFFLEILEDGN